jgi:DNA-3-methyladenine glycosylase II
LDLGVSMGGRTLLHLDARPKRPYRELAADPTMRGLILRYGELRLKRRPPFATLSRSIIAQQISTKAADTVRQRLARRFGSAPDLIATAGIRAIRSVGLSQVKARCLREVANLARAGDFDGFEQLPDPDVITRLLTIRGIGPWTAQMFLIFSLARRDIWPTVDAGLRAAASRLYGVDSESSLERLGLRFCPMRSVAALYLWKSLANTAPGSR